MFRVYFALQRGKGERWVWTDRTLQRETYAEAAADAMKLRAKTGKSAQVFAAWVKG